MDKRGKGNRFERIIGKWLLKNDGPCPHWGGMASKAGRVGHITDLGFDFISRSYVGEAKHRKILPLWLTRTWKQANFQATQHKKNPVLFLKETNGATLHIISPERHAELLKYERSYKINKKEEE